MMIGQTCALAHLAGRGRRSAAKGHCQAAGSDGRLVFGGLPELVHGILNQLTTGRLWCHNDILHV